MTDHTDSSESARTDVTGSPTVDSIASDQQVSVRIVGAVAAATDTDPLELPPLADTIDPDAIDDIFAKRSEGNELSFDFAGTRVTITDGEPITVDVRQSD